MKKGKYLLTLLAAGTILTAGIGQAMAYFTTYAEAQGGDIVWLGDETTITETFTNWTKVLTITNTEGQPVFVRAKVFYAPVDEVEVLCTGEGWSENLPNPELSEAGQDVSESSTSYYYYNVPIAAGVSAEPLNVKIDKIPEKVALGDLFNVIVIYESTPALYDENGNAYADWTSKLVVTKRETSNSGNTQGPDNETVKDDNTNNNEEGGSES